MTVSKSIDTPDFQLCTEYRLHNDITFECQGDMILSWNSNQNTGIGYCGQGTNGLFHQKFYPVHGDFFNPNGFTDRIT